MTTAAAYPSDDSVLAGYQEEIHRHGSGLYCVYIRFNRDTERGRRMPPGRDRLCGKPDGSAPCDRGFGFCQPDAAVFRRLPERSCFSTLKYGATTYLVPKQLFMFPVKLVEFLNEYKINTVCWVVSALTMISSMKTFDKVIPEYLHTVAFGSEVFPDQSSSISGGRRCRMPGLSICTARPRRQA